MSYILPQYHKQLISDIQRTELFPLLSTFDDHGFSIILRTWFQHRDYFENMTVLLEVLDFLGRQQQPLAEAQYSGKF